MLQTDPKILERRGDLSEEVVVKRRKAAADPVRQRVMAKFYGDRDWTAKELAASLGLGVNGLYYHLRLLEDAQLIVPTAGRPGDRGMERTYRLAANQHVDFELNEDLALAFTALLEAAKHDVTEAVYDAIAGDDGAEDSWRPFVGVNSPAFDTTHEEIAEFGRRVFELVREFRDHAKDLQAVGADPSSPWRRLQFTYALRERRISEESASE